jgi:hypothetical protein
MSQSNPVEVRTNARASTKATAWIGRTHIATVWAEDGQRHAKAELMLTPQELRWLADAVDAWAP